MILLMQILFNSDETASLFGIYLVRAILGLPKLWNSEKISIRSQQMMIFLGNLKNMF